MIHAYIDQRTGDLMIFIIQVINGKDTAVLKLEGETKTWVPIEELSDYPPTIRINRHLVPDLVSQLNKLNVKSDNHFKIEGELDATRYHLEDLRTLLKLRK